MVPRNIIIACAVVLVVFGFVTMGVGLIILLRDALSRRYRDIKEEITNMATKGLLSGLQESLEAATFLMKEMNSLMQTEIGAGLSLLLIGTLLVIGGLYLLFKFNVPEVPPMVLPVEGL